MWSLLALVAFFLLILRYFWSTQELNELANLNVLITGCDTGFGRILAQELDEKNVNVYAGCLNENSVKELRESCSPKLKPILLDVTNQDHIKKAYNYVTDDLGEDALWCVVNNAGIMSPLVPFDWTTSNDFRKVMDVNFFGMVDVTRTFLPLIKRGKEGRIVNVGSMNGRFSYMASPYASSKYAVESFSDGLSYCLEPFNITSHTIEPGSFRTNINKPEHVTKLIRTRWENLDESVKEEYGNNYIELLCRYHTATIERYSSPQVELVIQAMTQAVIGKYPRNRYQCGLEANTVIWAVTLLPFYIQMATVKVLFRLSGLRKPNPVTPRNGKGANRKVRNASK